MSENLTKLGGFYIIFPLQGLTYCEFRRGTDVCSVEPDLLVEERDNLFM